MQCSLILLLLPIFIFDFSPEYLRSCGSSPITAKGNILLLSPIVVYPSITTFDFISQLFPITTLSPIPLNAPIVDPSPIFALLLTIAVECIFTLFLSSF